MARVVGAGAGDDRDRDRLDHRREQAQPLVVGEHRRLAGGAGDDEPVVAVGLQVPGELGGNVEIELALVVERRDHRRQDATEVRHEPIVRPSRASDRTMAPMANHATVRRSASWPATTCRPSCAMPRGTAITTTCTARCCAPPSRRSAPGHTTSLVANCRQAPTSATPGSSPAPATTPTATSRGSSPCASSSPPCSSTNRAWSACASVIRPSPMRSAGGRRTPARGRPARRCSTSRTRRGSKAVRCESTPCTRTSPARSRPAPARSLAATRPTIRCSSWATTSCASRTTPSTTPTTSAPWSKRAGRGWATTITDAALATIERDDVDNEIVGRWLTDFLLDRRR